MAFEKPGGLEKRVLVIEDDVYNRVFFCAVLEDKGYRVEQVADERQALAEAERFKPDLIVMDIQMPHISGIELIRTIKESALLGDIPVLAVTGYVGRDEEREIREAGAIDYLPKPVSIAPFLAAVDRLLLQEAA